MACGWLLFPLVIVYRYLVIFYRSSMNYFGYLVLASRWLICWGENLLSPLFPSFVSHIIPPLAATTFNATPSTRIRLGDSYLIAILYYSSVTHYHVLSSMVCAGLPSKKATDPTGGNRYQSDRAKHYTVSHRRPYQSYHVIPTSRVAKHAPRNFNGYSVVGLSI